MKTEASDRASAIFLALSQVAPDQRAHRLAEACGTDDDLRSEVQRLLDGLDLLDTFQHSSAHPRAFADDSGITQPAGASIGDFSPAAFRSAMTIRPSPSWPAALSATRLRASDRSCTASAAAISKSSSRARSRRKRIDAIPPLPRSRAICGAIWRDSRSRRPRIPRGMSCGDSWDAIASRWR